MWDFVWLYVILTSFNSWVCHFSEESPIGLTKSMDFWWDTNMLISSLCTFQCTSKSRCVHFLSIDCAKPSPQGYKLIHLTVKSSWFFECKKKDHYSNKHYFTGSWCQLNVLHFTEVVFGCSSGRCHSKPSYSVLTTGFMSVTIKASSENRHSPLLPAINIHSTPPIPS